MRKCVIVFLMALCNSSVYAADGDLVWPLPKICQKDEYKNECFCSTDGPTKRSGAYSIDERKYVSDYEWAAKAPYKYVLRMLLPNEDTGKPETGCTGNMINGKIVTARHCLDDEMRCGRDRKTYTFRMYDGTELRAKVSECGDPNEKYTGDWVIMDVVNDAKKRIVHEHSLTSIENIKGAAQIKQFAIENGNKRLVSSGFDGLKVMNDAEIEIFQRAYVAFQKNLEMNMDASEVFIEVFATGEMFLKDLTVATKCNALMYEYNRTHSDDVKYAYETECLWPEGMEPGLYGMRQYAGFNYGACGLDYYDLFDNGEYMKVSICSAGTIKPITDNIEAVLAGDYAVLSDGDMLTAECQNWSGRSGGGIYLERERDNYSVVGITSAGIPVIGGKQNASSNTTMYVPAGNFADKLKSD